MRTVPRQELPPLDTEGRLDVTIEVPRFSFAKRDASGALQLLSPLPCPFNYGSIPGTRAADGDAIDVLVMGPRRSRATRLRAMPRARVRFIDAGVDDPKWICADAPLTALQLAQVDAFFRLYAAAKRVLYALHGLRRITQAPQTRYEGIDLVAVRG